LLKTWGALNRKKEVGIERKGGDWDREKRRRGKPKLGKTPCQKLTVRAGDRGEKNEIKRSEEEGVAMDKSSCGLKKID